MGQQRQRGRALKGSALMTGQGLASGDINGDGFDDIIIGAPQSRENPFQIGHVYIFLGRTQLDPLIDLNENTPDITISGGDSLGQFGEKILVDDFSEDQIDDILIAEPQSSPLNRLNAGAVFLFYGKNNNC